MSKEMAPDAHLNLDDYQGDAGLLSEISLWEQKEVPIVTLTTSLSDFDRIRTALLALRSANISPVLLLQRQEALLEDEEIAAIFRFLRDQDQLVLVNFLEICGEWVAPQFQKVLQTEAKIELKWFREWMSAASDRRIHKYPGLPWRRFIRQIMAENYSFAIDFLRLAGADNTPENQAATEKRLRELLEAKKKVVCIFPKRWGHGT
jgi:hypothetical protein